MTTISYTVGPTNRIVEIDGPWDEFAGANGAPGLTRERVLNMPLFDFVTGPQADEVVKLLLGRARGGHAVRIHFRCDSPTVRRFLRLDMHARADGSVRCDSTLEREEARPAQPLLDPAVPRSDELVVMCSWCKKVKLADGRWTEIEDAVERLGFFGLPVVPRVSHGICDPCMDAVRRSVRSRSEGAPAPD